MTGAGEVLGSTATGVLLSPEVLRKVACDAALVPHVLGTAGEDLDLGRVVRLFTRAQRRRLWRRDRTCTFPGCRQPGHRCDLDHRDPFDPDRPADDQTCAANLHCLCRHHHEAKTKGLWKVGHDPTTGTTWWTSPMGITHARHARPPLTPTPPEPPDPDPDPPPF